MQILSYKLPMDCNIFLIGDDHNGARLRFLLGWNQMVEMVNSEYYGLPASRNFVVDHGDIIEAIMVDDPRFSFADTREAAILAQLQAAVEARWEIRKKILCILDGNHPRKLWRFGELTKHVCKELGIENRYGTYSAKLIYNNTKGELMFKHFAFHGAGSINSTADSHERRQTTMKLALKKKLMDLAGDTLLMSMGHTHKLLMLSPQERLELVDDGADVKQRYSGPGMGNEPEIHSSKRWYVNTGAFLKLYGKGFSGYAEIAGYKPIELGFQVALVRAGTIVDIVKEVV